MLSAYLLFRIYCGLLGDSIRPIFVHDFSARYILSNCKKSDEYWSVLLFKLGYLDILYFLIFVSHGTTDEFNYLTNILLFL